MNMKKTIAAVAAATVAVSAMATTVSADTTLNFNLVREVGTVKHDVATVTISATFTNVKLNAGGTLEITPKFDGGDAGYQAGNLMVITGRYSGEENLIFTPITVTADKSRSEWNNEGESLIVTTPDADKGKVKVNIKEGTKGTTTSLVAGTADITVTYTYTKVNNEVYSSLEATNNKIADGDIGLSIVSGTPAHDAYSAAAGGVTIDDLTEAEADALAAKTYTAVVDQHATITLSFGSTDAASYEESDFTIPTGAAATALEDDFAAEGNEKQITASGTVADDLAAFGITYDGEETITGATLTITISYTPATYKWNAEAVADGFGEATPPDGADDELTPTKGGPTPVAASTEYDSKNDNTVAGGRTVYDAGTNSAYRLAPYKSDLSTYGIGYNNPYYSPEYNTSLLGVPSGDIITYLQTQAVNPAAAAKTLPGGANGVYTNVSAVLNDAAQNYDVTFTFHSSNGQIVLDPDGSGQDVYANSWEIDQSWVTIRGNYGTFGQQLYPLYTDANGSELTTNIGITNWYGINLFNSALIVNGDFTMSLADTDKFDWQADSVSFSWDSILDSAAENNITNPYALWIHSMGLVTSTPWYWDTLEVTLADKNADDASADAGIDSDDTEIDDEDGDELGDDDDDWGDDDGEDFAGEDDGDDVQTVVDNPKTGNASVALAVIPVALAAAAVVAKKRS